MIIINIYRIQDEPRNLELWLEKFKKSSVTSIILLLRSLQKKKTMRRAYSYSRLGTYFFNHRKIIYFIVTSFHLTITFSICKIFISWAIFFFFIVDAFYTNSIQKQKQVRKNDLCLCDARSYRRTFLVTDIYICMYIYFFFVRNFTR